MVPESEFDERVELTADQCVVDGAHFFVRGHIELPIKDSNEHFIWSVWCSLSEQSFAHMTQRWEEPDREGHGYFGWLCTSLPVYPSTLHLAANVLVRAVGLVPLVELQQCEHPLYLDQHDGLTMDRVHGLVHELMHEQS